MPLGRAPKRMFGSGFKSDCAWGHWPALSLGAGVAWGAPGSRTGAWPSFGRLNPAAEVVRARSARAARATRGVLIIEPLEAPPAGDTCPVAMLRSRRRRPRRKRPMAVPTMLQIGQDRRPAGQMPLAWADSLNEEYRQLQLGGR